MSKNQAMKQMLAHPRAREIDTRPGAHSMLPQNQPKGISFAEAFDKTIADIARVFRVDPRWLDDRKYIGTGR